MTERVHVETVAALALAAAGAYVAWRVLRELANVTNAGTEAIAKAWIWATSPAVRPSGRIVLPDGRAIGADELERSWFDQSEGVMHFDYRGHEYVILPNPSGGPAYDTEGNYHAELA